MEKILKKIIGILKYRRIKFGSVKFERKTISRKLIFKIGKTRKKGRNQTKIIENIQEKLKN